MLFKILCPIYRKGCQDSFFFKVILENNKIENPKPLYSAMYVSIWGKKIYIYFLL